jgi:single-stranded-DNA-specific exonuclease
VTESSPLLLPKPFLGVTNSALGRTWVERCDAAQGTIALAIAQTHGLPDVLSRVLAGRGVGIHDTEGFLNPRLRDLMPDPHRLTDMEAAASRLADAVMGN